MKVSLGRDGWYLCDWADHPNFAYEQVPAGSEIALHWLSQFRSDFYTLAGLRRLFADGLYRDDEVLQQVAARLARGAWKARRRLPDRLETAAILDEGVAPSFPLEERRRAVAPAAAPAPDAPAFPPDTDLLVIAAAQKTAAAAGAPFCEECLKAQLAAAAPSIPLQERRPAPSPVATPPAEKPDFPPDADLLLIAAAKKAAAEEGVPFCEECLKAQLAAAPPASSPPSEARPAPPAVGSSPTGTAAAPAMDPGAFPPDADLLVIAAAQRAAAEEGVPFCEECLKAQLAAGR